MKPVLAIAVAIAAGLGASAPQSAPPRRERLAHRRQRPGRDEVLAAHPDHAGERRAADEGVDLRHGRAGDRLHHHADRRQQRHVPPGAGIDDRRAQGRRGHRAVEVRPQDDPGHRRRTRRRAAAASPTGPARRRPAPRIVIATTNGFLVQLDAKTGKPIPGPAGLDQPRHRRHGEVRRQLLDEHAARALQEPGDHRGAHRRTGPLRAFLAIRARSTC